MRYFLCFVFLVLYPLRLPLLAGGEKGSGEILDFFQLPLLAGGVIERSEMWGYMGNGSGVIQRSEMWG